MRLLLRGLCYPFTGPPRPRGELHYLPLNAAGSRAWLPTGGVKESEGKGDDGGGVVYNMWVYVTAAAVITAL